MTLEFSTAKAAERRGTRIAARPRQGRCAIWRRSRKGGAPHGVRVRAGWGCLWDGVSTKQNARKG